ncbi:rhodanese-like domain-containing protein [Streptomyces sp. CG1]|uniref:rhodanese-like domain-containing protein n=1 Tax=Streptomyces sp. CG1 TaxID=1287523 RepID=UPI0034E24458
MADVDTLTRVFRDYLASMPPQLNYILPEDLAIAVREEEDKFFILDNRTPEAYAAGHIPGAVNIWMKDLLAPNNLARLPRDKKIVVCCWVGHTASQLLPILSTLGFDAIGLKYGMGTAKQSSESKLGWAEQNLPVETNKA